MTSAEIVAAIGLLSNALSIVITRFFTKRKNKAEVLSYELENAQKVVQLWRNLSEEQSKKIEELETRINELQEALDKLGEKYQEQCVACEYRLAFINKNKNKNEKS